MNSSAILILKKVKNITLAFHAYYQNPLEIPLPCEDDISEIDSTQDSPPQSSSNILNPLPIEPSDLKLKLLKLTLLEGSVRILNKETFKWADEIKSFSRESNTLLTRDEDPSREAQVSTTD